MIKFVNKVIKDVDLIYDKMKVIECYLSVFGIFIYSIEDVKEMFRGVDYVD